MKALNEVNERYDIDPKVLSSIENGALKLRSLEKILHAVSSCKCWLLFNFLTLNFFNSFN